MTVLYVLLAILLLGILIMVHEWGTSSPRGLRALR